VTDAAALRLPRLVATLRQAGLHARFSYKAARNLGKLIKDAAASRARVAVILGREMDEGQAVVKDLESGIQREVNVEQLLEELSG
jgi:histidyl-tRNA synthetase